MDTNGDLEPACGDAVGAADDVLRICAAAPPSSMNCCQLESAGTFAEAWREWVAARVVPAAESPDLAVDCDGAVAALVLDSSLVRVGAVEGSIPTLGLAGGPVCATEFSEACALASESGRFSNNASYSGGPEGRVWEEDARDCVVGTLDAAACDGWVAEEAASMAIGCTGVLVSCAISCPCGGSNCSIGGIVSEGLDELSGP